MAISDGETAPDASWVVRYAREHVAHLLVLLVVAAYPGIYAVLVESPVAAEMATLLPRVETMIAVLYFGLFAMSFDFISGYTGYLSFGHAVSYGTGAYFAMVTLGFAQVVYVFVRDWDYVSSSPRDSAAVTEKTGGFQVGVPGVDELILSDISL